MATKSEYYTPYELARWSMRIKQRDDMECFMCKRTCFKRNEIKKAVNGTARSSGLFGSTQYRLNGKWMTEQEAAGLLGEAHHIRAKFHYPKLALDLDNGVTLCWRCHRAVVHSTYETFRIYIYPCRMYALRGERKEFNNKYQPRIKERRSNYTK